MISVSLAAERWPVIARLRLAQPVYHVLFPPTRGTILTTQVFAACASAILVSLVASLERPGHASFLPLALLGTFAVVAGGVRRGQTRYAAERESCRDLAGLVAINPADLYYPATSRPQLRIALVVSLLGPLSVLISALANHRSLAWSITLGALYGLLPAVAISARELASHVAVASAAFRIPQYVYAIAGVASGLAMARLGSPLSHNRLSDLRGAPDGAVTPRIGLSILAIVVEVVVVLALMAFARRIAFLVCSTDLRGERLGARIPRWSALPLPLGVRLWTGLGREHSSVIMGFMALLTLLTVRGKDLLNLLPASSPSYERAELTVFLLYGVAFIASTTFEEPLQLAKVWGRLPLLSLAGVRPLREIRTLGLTILAPTGVATIIAGVLMQRAGAFAGVWPPTVVVVIAITVIAASSTTMLPALSGGGLDLGRITDELPLTMLIQSAFVGLLPACLAVGYEVSAERSAAAMFAVSLGVALVAIGLVTRIDLTTQRRTRSQCA